MKKDQSPSEKMNRAVIGTIKCRLIFVLANGSTKESETDEFEVIDIIEREDGSKIYVCNQWHKEGIPQIVHSSMVLSFDPK